MAIVTGRLKSEYLFPIESVDMRLLESLPKGSMEIFELLKLDAVDAIDVASS